MRKIFLAGVAIALLAGAAMAGPVAAKNPGPNPNYTDIPFPGAEANKTSFWELIWGKGTVCQKSQVDGNFTNVNSFDQTQGKYTEPQPTIRIWNPAPAMYGTPPSTVWKMNCNDRTPSPPAAVRNPYGQFYVCEGNKIWFELNNTQSTRPDTMTGRYPTKNGPEKVTKEVPPLKVWRSATYKVDLTSGGDAWVYSNSTDEFLVRRPADLAVSNASCSHKQGFSWN